MENIKLIPFSLSSEYFFMYSGENIFIVKLDKIQDKIKSLEAV